MGRGRGPCRHTRVLVVVTGACIGECAARLTVGSDCNLKATWDCVWERVRMFFYCPCTMLAGAVQVRMLH